MAIDLSKYIDNDLAAEFNAPVYDPLKGRAKALAGVKRTMDQFLATKPSTAPNKWFTVKGAVVKFTAVLNGQAIGIDDEEIVYIPKEQFAAFLTDFSAAIDAGDFDDEIEAALTAKAGSVAVSAAPKAKGTRVYSEASKLNIRVGGFRRGGMADDEIRAKLASEGVDKSTIDTALAYKAENK
jgi:carbon monoxide dehydrogenase subunit G